MSLLDEAFIGLCIFGTLYIIGRIWGIFPSPAEIRARDQKDKLERAERQAMPENNNGSGGLAEYALILGLMVVVAILALTFFRPQLDEALRLFAQLSEGR